MKWFHSTGFDFPVAIPSQHPYTLDGKRMLPAEPFCVAFMATTKVREVACPKVEE
jgi:hypothetical protein